MITLFRSNTIFPIHEAKKYMAEQIKQLPHKVSFIGTMSKVMRYELPCQPIPPLDWLQRQDSAQKIYFSSREGDFEMAGVGITDCISSKDNLSRDEIFDYFEEHLSSDNPQLRYYGGFSFDGNAVSPEWHGFGQFYFFIPRFEIYRMKKEYFFVCNIGFQDAEEEKAAELLRAVESLKFDSQRVPAMPFSSYRSREDLPDRKEWEKIFSTVIKDLKEHRLEKIVLARRSKFSFNERIDPVLLAQKLKESSPNCFHLFIQPKEDTAFLIASPERLYKREGRAIESEAIAGTRPRGKDLCEDAELKKELLESVKETREQRFVVEAIDESFRSLCQRFEVKDKKDVLKLAGGQHLITRFKGELKDKVYDREILNSLHPTPAVGGEPVEEALKAIQEQEPFSRGWYAAPVGYVGFDRTEFLVAIRSGLVQGGELSLYAGAGIIEGSDCNREWDEIEQKIGSFMKVFDAIKD